MKLTAVQGNRYALRIEPGDTIDITFDPMGVNAVSGDSGAIRALTVGSVSLPKGNMAVTCAIELDLLYKSVPMRTDLRCGLVVIKGNGAHNLRFVFDGETQRIPLNLEKINLGELLDETP